MRQDLTTDTVERYVEAAPEVLYDLVADVTRTPELTPDIVKVEWLDGATRAVVGARFKAINKAGRGPTWSNKPVIIAADRGREIAWSRTEAIGGTLEWRYRFEPEGTGTRVIESYEVTKQLPLIGWFLIGTVFGLKDRRRDLRASMLRTLDRIAELTEAKAPAAG
jgi:ribosome-associated toxin RatA of RatAB toxin-antitoxin module